MAGVSITYDLKGIEKLNINIEALKGYIATSLVPFKQAATIVTGSVIRNFDEGGRPKKWEALSLVTLFTRKYRKGKKNAVANTLVDTGRLKGSIMPHFSQSEEFGEFGAKTNVEYAGMMNNGGVTSPSMVVIAAFTRKAPHSNLSAIPAYAFKKRNKMSGMVRVMSYIMNFKGGATVPARPFMVVQEQDKPILKQIFMDWIKGMSNGEYRGH